MEPTDDDAASSTTAYAPIDTLLDLTSDGGSSRSSVSAAAQEWFREQWRQVELDHGAASSELARLRLLFHDLANDITPRYRLPSQRPDMFYLPTINATPIHAPSWYPFVAEIERHHDAIVREMLALSTLVPELDAPFDTRISLPDDERKDFVPSAGFAEYFGIDEKGILTSSGNWKVRERHPLVRSIHRTTMPIDQHHCLFDSMAARCACACVGLLLLQALCAAGSELLAMSRDGELARQADGRWRVGRRHDVLLAYHAWHPHHPTHWSEQHEVMQPSSKSLAIRWHDGTREIDRESILAH